jgi:adenylate cyclase
MWSLGGHPGVGLDGQPESPNGPPLTVGDWDSLTLRFRDPRLEEAYQREAAAPVRGQIRVGMLSATVLWAAAGILLPPLTGMEAWLAYSFTGFMVLANLVGLPFTRWAMTLNRLQIIGALLNALSGLVIVLIGIASPQAERYVAPALVLVTLFAFLVLRLRFVVAITAAAPYVLTFALVSLTAGRSGAVFELFLLLGAVFSAAAATYALETGARRVYYQGRVIVDQQRDLEKERDKSDRLLRNMLPEAILARLREDTGTVADAFPIATILFADLVDFTPLAERLLAEETVSLLNGLFSRLDDLAAIHGVEKIKTIGDAYMAVGGVPIAAADHAERVVSLGLDMLRVVHEYADEVGQPLVLRIGIHSGPVVAGVIGKQRYSYDLWGDTVNVASRMESHGVPDAIQVSEATWDRVRHSFAGVPRGEIDIKGKGKLRGYLITGPAPNGQKPTPTS